MGQKRRIIVVDDHPLFREGLKSLLARQPDYVVVGEAGNGREALAQVRDLTPDLVIMDISLPDGSGIDFAHGVREASPDTRVVILSMHLATDYITRAFRAGAMGYFTKESATERLIECLSSVFAGRYYLDPAVSHEVVRGLVRSEDGDAKGSGGGYANLTAREQQVLRLIAEGHSSKKIAQNLRISHKTVENHRANIMSKLDLHSTVDLVRYAAKYGIIDLQQWKK
jgi:DNA-binding NarL/FixJ family response regulator